MTVFELFRTVVAVPNRIADLLTTSRFEKSEKNVFLTELPVDGIAESVALAPLTVAALAQAKNSKERGLLDATDARKTAKTILFRRKERFFDFCPALLDFQRL